jgi:septal ring factor EnvC (AmiA/AmiB activator)
VSVAALGFLVILLAPFAAAEDVPDLDTLRDAILETRERVGGHERQERALLEQLEESDRLSAALTREVRSARRDADEARERAILFEAKRLEASARLAKTREAMSRRVVALYKAGEIGPVRFLFASETVPELLTRASALQTFVEYDAVLVARYRENLSDYDQLETEAKVAAVVRDETARRLSKRAAELAQERTHRRRILTDVREDRSRERGLLVELEKAARALEETLSALGSASGEQGPSVVGQDFAMRKGSLARPLEAPIRLPFGRVVDEIFGTETLRKGVEFEAAAGETVRAVAPGAVRFAGWFRGYGKLVIMDHGDDYFTVVSHLEESFVRVGDTLSEGDTIGSVGDTGSLTGPSLYFEIRSGSEPQDPGDWLRPQGASLSRSFR